MCREKYHQTVEDQSGYLKYDCLLHAINSPVFVLFFLVPVNVFVKALMFGEYT